jgi:hypothetical protein
MRAIGVSDPIRWAESATVIAGTHTVLGLRASQNVVVQYSTVRDSQPRLSCSPVVVNVGLGPRTASRQSEARGVTLMTRTGSSSQQTLAVATQPFRSLARCCRALTTLSGSSPA